MADEMGNAHAEATPLAEITKNGLGHFSRVYGTRPVDPVARAQWLWEEQRRLKTSTRLGFPALVHVVFLTVLDEWQAAHFTISRVRAYAVVHHLVSALLSR